MTILDDLAEPLKSYSNTGSPQWTKSRRQNVIYVLAAFHRWLDQNQLTLETVTRNDVFRHVAKPRGRPAAPAYQATSLRRN